VRIGNGAMVHFRRAALTAVVLGWVLLAGSPPAHAQSAVFDEAYQRGVDAFNLGKYDEAREHFDKARKTDPKKPGPHRWLGLVAKERKDWRACLDGFRQAMRLNPRSEHLGRMQAEHSYCRQQLGFPLYPGELVDKQGAIAVISNVEGATVEVDGLKKGATPLMPFPVNPGTHKIQVERRGYITVTEQLLVVEGIVNDLEVTLVVDPNARTEDRAASDGVPAEVTVGWLVVSTNVGGRASVKLDGKAVAQRADGAIETKPGTHVLEVSADGHEPWLRRVTVVRGQKRGVAATLKSSESRSHERRMAYWTLGAAGVTGAAGVLFGFLENQKYDEATEAAYLERTRPEDSSLPPGSPDSEMRTREEIDELSDSGRRFGLISNLSYGVAAVSLGFSIYYFIQERGDERQGQELPMALVPTLDGDGHRGAQVVYTTELDF
jgi:hypothetical protein